MDVFTSEPWETDFVAKLVEHHALAKVELDELNPYKDKHLKSAFPKLLALLRIADALDTDPSSHTKIRKVRIQKHRVRLFRKRRKRARIASRRATATSFCRCVQTPTRNPAQVSFRLFELD